MPEDKYTRAGRLLGSVKSPVKAAAAKENGKKGGRPKKKFEVKSFYIPTHKPLSK